MSHSNTADSYQKFGEIIGEFSFGLTYTEFSYGGNKFSYLGVEVPLLLVGYLSDAATVGVRDADGNVVQVPRADMPGLFAAMFAAVDPQRAAFAAKYKEWASAGDEGVQHIDASQGWATRSAALRAFEDAGK